MKSNKAKRSTTAIPVPHSVPGSGTITIGTPPHTESTTITISGTCTDDYKNPSITVNQSILPTFGTTKFILSDDNTYQILTDKTKVESGELILSDDGGEFIVVTRMVKITYYYIKSIDGVPTIDYVSIPMTCSIKRPASSSSSSSSSNSFDDTDMDTDTWIDTDTEIWTDTECSSSSSSSSSSRSDSSTSESDTTMVEEDTGMDTTMVEEDTQVPDNVNCGRCCRKCGKYRFECNCRCLHHPTVKLKNCRCICPGCSNQLWECTCP